MKRNKSLLIIKIIILFICFMNLFSQPSFAGSSKLKAKLSSFFQKIEKKIDEKSNENETKTKTKTTNIKPDIASVTVIVASTTKKLTLEDFGLLPQEEVKVNKLSTVYFGDKYDVKDKYSLWGCQGMTSDGTYLYIALWGTGKKGKAEEYSKILKIELQNLKVIKQQEMGLIGHCNSLTYNSKTKKIYAAPLYKNFNCIFEFDTDLQNLKEVNLFDQNGTIIKNKEFRSITYLPSSDNYVVKYNDELSLNYFDSNFKLIKIVKTKQPFCLKKGNTSQALSTDEIIFYSLTNTIISKDKIINYILIYDMDVNYIEKYTLVDNFENNIELQQITYVGNKYVGVGPVFGSRKFNIYQIEFKKEKDSK